MNVALPDLGATAGLARVLAGRCHGKVVFLEGPLGAGKTTLVREVLSALGWTGPVRSPSYALVHTYRLAHTTFHHLDLYRLGSLEEAMGLDLDPLLAEEATTWIEWPDRLEGAVVPSWTIGLEPHGEGRLARLQGVEALREAILAATPTWRTA